VPVTVEQLADSVEEDFCYVTTRGRVTGEPHEIEIWFALDSTTIYLLSGGGDRSDWVRNIRADGSVTVRVGEHTFNADARIVESASDEDARARQLVYDKYQPRYSGSLESWRERSLPVAIDVGASQS
jgi:deazaflavin-dependent oxidoreductase (nitroreductase family)